MIKIDVSTWKKFRVGDLFYQERGKEPSPARLCEGNMPLVAEINDNNGVLKYADGTHLFDGNAVTVSVNYAENVFYQPESFCASVNILILRNDEMTLLSGLFVAGVLHKLHQGKFDYINKISKDRLNDEILLLPVTSAGTPDWNYMENYMKQVMEKEEAFASQLESLSTEAAADGHEMDVSKWGEFRVGDLFDIIRGKSCVMRDLMDGDTSLIAAARANQGVAGTYDLDAEYHDAITVSCNGAGCGSTYYHDGEFAITGDAAVCVAKEDMSKFAKMFIAAVFDKCFSEKFSYAEKCGPAVLSDEFVKLPVTPAGTPDWTYMEQFMQQQLDKNQQLVEHLDMIWKD